MASGGTRHDFTSDENITSGEDRTLPYVMSADSVLTGIATWAVSWYLMRDADDAEADAVTTYTKAGGDISLDTEAADGDTFNVAVAEADSEDWEQGRRYWHELWKESPAPRSRLSYGWFQVVE